MTEPPVPPPPSPGERPPLSADLPYRPNVGIVLLDARGLAFAGRAFPNPHGWPDPEVFAGGADWILPQGGIDPGEDIVAAARRELWEETGVTSADVIAATDDWWTYDFPARGAPTHKLFPYRGQRQRWVAFRFTGTEGEIRIDAAHTEEPAELREWRWRPVEDLISVGAVHRRPIYERVAAWVAGIGR